MKVAAGGLAGVSHSFLASFLLVFHSRWVGATGQESLGRRMQYLLSVDEAPLCEQGHVLMQKCGNAGTRCFAAGNKNWARMHPLGYKGVLDFRGGGRVALSWKFDCGVQCAAQEPRFMAAGHALTNHLGSAGDKSQAGGVMHHTLIEMQPEGLFNDTLCRGGQLIAQSFHVDGGSCTTVAGRLPESDMWVLGMAKLVLGIHLEMDQVGGGPTAYVEVSALWSDAPKRSLVLGADLDLGAVRHNLNRGCTANGCPWWSERAGPLQLSTTPSKEDARLGAIKVSKLGSIPRPAHSVGMSASMKAVEDSSAYCEFTFGAFTHDGGGDCFAEPWMLFGNASDSGRTDSPVVEASVKCQMNVGADKAIAVFIDKFRWVFPPGYDLDRSAGATVSPITTTATAVSELAGMTAAKTTMTTSKEIDRVWTALGGGDHIADNQGSTLAVATVTNSEACGLECRAELGCNSAMFCSISGECVMRDMVLNGDEPSHIYIGMQGCGTWFLSLSPMMSTSTATSSLRATDSPLSARECRSNNDEDGEDQVPLGDVGWWTIQTFIVAAGSDPLGQAVGAFNEIFGYAQSPSANCVPYPSSTTAPFCGGRLRHSHHVPIALGSEEEAAKRDESARLAYEEIATTSDLQSNFVGNALAQHPVCDFAVRDGLCLRVLPMCYCADVTACRMACRNLALCLRALPGAEERAPCIDEECDARCAALLAQQDSDRCMDHASVSQRRDVVSAAAVLLVPGIVAVG